VAEEGGFPYNADSCSDDVPYWQSVDGKPQLIVPYTLDVNDMKFGAARRGSIAANSFSPTSGQFCLFLSGRG
jgi:peptidoglycan/xylan/chitin deacetylase (PgdA/CDA1 family)